MSRPAAGVSTSTVSDDGKGRLRVLVEVSRRRRLFEAIVPADMSPADLEIFLIEVRRRLTAWQTGGARNNG